MARTRTAKPKPEAEGAAKTKAPPPAIEAPAAAPSPPAAKPLTGKLATLAALLLRPEGATLAQMVEATGWQAHSVRGALAGALKARGVAATSTKAEGVRTYRATSPEAAA